MAALVTALALVIAVLALAAVLVLTAVVGVLQRRLTELTKVVTIPADQRSSIADTFLGLRGAEAAALGADAGEQTLLFLSQDCLGCSMLVAELEEKPFLAPLYLVWNGLGGSLAVDGSTVIDGERGRQLWMAFRVPGTPFRVHVGRDGLISEIGPAVSTYAQG
jgi:hypothetical protein